MTPQELKELQTNARIAALEGLLAMLISALSRSESARKANALELDRWVLSLDKMTFPPVPSEYSDLYAAEFQQAAQSLVAFVKSNLQKLDVCMRGAGYESKAAARGRLEVVFHELCQEGEIFLDAFGHMRARIQVNHLIAGRGGEHIPRVLALLRPQELDRSFAQVHRMCLALLHPPRRHRPGAGLQIDLAPFDVQGFAGARRSQDPC